MLSIARVTIFSIVGILAFVTGGMFIMVGIMRFWERIIPLMDHFWQAVIP